jgi:N-acyl-L-homoserine lactone synthetase
MNLQAERHLGDHDVAAVTFSAPDALPPLAERIATLRKKVEAFVVSAPEDKAEVYRLRYRCYLKEQAIQENGHETLSDAYDDHRRAITMGIRLGTEIVASIRLHLLDAENAESPTSMAFGDYVNGMLCEQHTVVDCSRFVVDHLASREHPELAYLALSWPIALAEIHQVTRILAAVRKEHMAFYSRILRCQMICTPRPYLQLIKPLGLMSVDYLAEKANVFRRYPFFKPSSSDMEMLRSLRN